MPSDKISENKVAAPAAVAAAPSPSKPAPGSPLRGKAKVYFRVVSGDLEFDSCEVLGWVVGSDGKAKSVRMDADLPGGVRQQLSKAVAEALAKAGG